MRACREADFTRSPVHSFTQLVLLASACKAFALAGGALFAALTLISAASIIGRFAGRPLQGDFELVQLGCAVAISFCLPYCQLRRGNIIVDFFTVRTSTRTRGALDAFGALLLALTMALVAWRTGAGALAIRASNETSMIMGVPVWYSYALMTPAFALTAVAGLDAAWRYWRAP
jgi:TRAP-type C4-dicarboxylate transport system permease small subunit